MWRNLPHSTRFSRSIVFFYFCQITYFFLEKNLGSLNWGKRKKVIFDCCVLITKREPLVGFQWMSLCRFRVINKLLNSIDSGTRPTENYYTPSNGEVREKHAHTRKQFGSSDDGDRRTTKFFRDRKKLNYKLKNVTQTLMFDSSSVTSSLSQFRSFFFCLSLIFSTLSGYTYLLFAHNTQYYWCRKRLSSSSPNFHVIFHSVRSW